MKLKSMLGELRQIQWKHSEELEVTCNKQGEYCYLIFKNELGEIVDCMIL